MRHGSERDSPLRHTAAKIKGVGGLKWFGESKFSFADMQPTLTSVH